MATADTQFKKGVIPWNKDKKGVQSSTRKGKKLLPLSVEYKEKISIKMQKEKHPMWKGGLPKCLDCGKELNNYNNKWCIEHGKCIGIKNGNWKEDRNLLVKSEMKHLDGQYRDWMFAVKNRDDWKCKINKDCKGRLEAHHILNWKNYPELRYEVNNGITLCLAHHPRGRVNEAKLSPYLQSLVAERN